MDTRSFVKTILKTLLLFFILVCIFLLFYPHACENLLYQNQTGLISTHAVKDGEPVPATEGLRVSAAHDAPVIPAPSSSTVYVQPITPYERNYEIIKDYVRMEREASKAAPLTARVSNELVNAIIHKYKLNPGEWEMILEQANQADWMSQARIEVAAEDLAKSKPSTAPLPTR